MNLLTAGKKLTLLLYLVHWDYLLYFPMQVQCVLLAMLEKDK